MLGSTTPFTGIDFTQTLYLGVTVASDTEMTPRKIIGAVPAAFIAGTSTIALSANTLQGITPGQFFRNDQQNSTSSASTFLSVLQTGAGKIAEFFGSAGQSALAILSNGIVGIGSSTPSATLTIQGTSSLATTNLLSIASSSGASVLTVLSNGYFGLGTSSPIASFSFQGTAQATTSSPNSYSFVVNGGNGTILGGAGGNGGGVLFTTGNGASAGTAGTGGDFTVNTGNGGTLNRGGNMTFTLGNGGGTSNLGGSFSLTAGNGGPSSGSPSGAGGAVTISAGNGGVQGAGSAGAGAGVLTLNGGNAGSVSSGGVNGGNIILMPGLGSGTGLRGLVGIGTSSPSNTLEVNGSGYFTGNITAANITATGTLAVTGTTTTGGLSVASLNGLLFGTNGAVTAISTSSLGITNYWSQSGATTTNNVANVVSTLGVFGTIQATSTTGTSTFAGALGIGSTTSPTATLQVTGSAGNTNVLSVTGGAGVNALVAGGAGGVVFTLGNGGSGGTSGGLGGAFNFTAGNGGAGTSGGAPSGVGGGLSLIAGNGGTGTSGGLGANGGNVTLQAGSAGTGGGTPHAGYILLSGGNVGIGSTSPSNLLTVAGNGWFNGNITGTNFIATGTLNVSGQTSLVNASTTNLTVLNLLKTTNLTATGTVTFSNALTVSNGGTGLSTLGSGYIPYGQGTSAFGGNVNLQTNGSGEIVASKALEAGINTLGSQDGGVLYGNNKNGSFYTNLVLESSSTTPGLYDSSNDGNAKIMAGVDTNGNANMSIQRGASGSQQSSAIYSDWEWDDAVDYNIRFIMTDPGHFQVLDGFTNGASTATAFELENYGGVQIVNSGLSVGTTNSDNPLQIVSTSTGKLLFSVLDNGNVGIGSSSPSNLLTVAGNGWFSGNITGTNLTATGTLTVLGKTTLANASTTNITNSGFLNVTGTTTTGGLKISSLATTFLAVDTSGNVIATTTPTGTGTNYFSNSGATTTLTTGSNLVAALFTAPYFIATSTTATSTFAGDLIVDGNTFGVSSINNLVFIGTTSDQWNPSMPGKLTIDMGAGNTSENAVDAHGTVNDFLQYNITNHSTGINAQSGYAATADTGTLTSGFMWMGINNSGYATTTAYNVGAALDSNILSSSNDLYIAQAIGGKKTHFLNGGVSTSTNEVMTFSGNNVGIGSTSPSNLLTVAGNGWFNGNITGTNFIATGTLTVSGAATFNSTATTTFVGGISVANGSSTIDTKGNNMSQSYWALGTSSSAFTDGVAIDYIQAANGNGRISVGPNDSLSFYNGGLGTNRLGYFDPSANFYTGTVNATSTTGTSTFAGFVGIGTTTPTAELTLTGNTSVPITGSGAITASNGSTTVTGIGTTFTTDFTVGDAIKFGTNPKIYLIASISSSTLLNLTTSFTDATSTTLVAYKDPDLFTLYNGFGVNKFTVNKSGTLTTDLGISGNITFSGGSRTISNASAGNISISTLAGGAGSISVSPGSAAAMTSAGTGFSAGGFVFTGSTGADSLIAGSQTPGNIGGAGGGVTITGGVGGNAGSSTSFSNTGGAGGGFSFTGGTGGIAVNTTTNANSGAGGGVSLIGGVGASGVTADIVGGTGGGFTLASGAGGVGGAGKTSGNAGTLSFVGGAGGANINATTTGTNTGGNGATFSFSGGAGGNTKSALLNIGGTGSTLTFTAGNGGGVSSGVSGGTNTAGAGGNIIFAAGNGGTVSTTTGVTGVGANGGYLSFVGGSGSNVAGLTNNGGNIYFAGGAGSPSGSAGNIILGITSGGLYQGNVGIGTSSPIATLSVMGTSSVGVNPFVVASSSNAQMLTLLQNGNFGIGSSSPSNMLTVSGNAWFNGNITGTNIVATGTLNVTGNLNVGAGALTAALGVKGTAGTNPFIIASSSATVPYMFTLLQNGNVGIGSTTPSAKLSIHDNSGLAGTNPLFTIASSTSANAATTTLFTILGNGRVGIGTTTLTSTFTVQGSACFSTTTLVGARVACGTNSGSIYYGSANTGFYDVAEDYLTSDPSIVAGEIVSLDSSRTQNVIRATSGNRVIGIVSTNPGLLLGGADASILSATKVPIALAGRVPVKVNLEGGSISIGDSLTLSSTPGVGMKATGSSDIIGIALQPYTDTGIGSIDVFVNLRQSVDLNQFALASSTAASTTIIADELTATLASIQSLQTRSADLGTQMVTLASTTLTLASTTAATLASSTSFIQTIANAVINILNQSGQVISSAGNWTMGQITAMTGTFQKIMVRRIEFQTAVVSQGLEMTDQATGLVYCVVIKNGEWDKTQGECGDTNATTTITSIPIASSMPSTGSYTQITSTPVQNGISQNVGTTSVTVVSDLATSTAVVPGTSTPTTSIATIATSSPSVPTQVIDTTTTGSDANTASINTNTTSTTNTTQSDTVVPPASTDSTPAPAPQSIPTAVN